MTTKRSTFYTCRCGHTSTSEKAAREHANAPTPQSTPLQPGCPKVLGKFPAAQYPAKQPKPAALAKNGRAALEDELEAPKKSAKQYVTIWYESEGGEVLRTDVGPLTYQAADKLVTCLRGSRALRVDVREPAYNATTFITTTKFDRVVSNDVTRLARVVTLPSEQAIDREAA